MATNPVGKEAVSAVRKKTTPDRSSPSKSFRMIGGHRYQILFWPLDRWKRVPRSDRPKTAQRQGMDGWIEIIAPR